MHVFALKQCDTCRKALSALRAAGHDPVVTDVRADGIPPDTLAEIHRIFGDALVNRRSTTWRGLSEAEREAPALDLLVRHPTLMKRPVIHDGQGWHLGWGPEVRKSVLG
ncbi:arsenate reductase family protein [Roseisalinus antarcticus]|uniref:Putative reductase n=1 Tax=Roseisalinus antarcticus TaxID=254357 RepID=A0A1Y5SWF6_9RHOB|nr:ArsC/Spx/MgsR family protein [Roseisalinus antarcticus]SLN48119.1 putative reductase [Roseisalinus antarcticus]